MRLNTINPITLLVALAMSIGMYTPNAKAQGGCPADITADGIVDGNDLGNLFGSWGSDGGVAADINGDGIVNVTDLLRVVEDWGRVPPDCGSSTSSEGVYLGTSSEQITNTISGYETYRLYVNLAPGARLDAVFGNAEYPMSIESTAGFYQDIHGGPVSNSINSDFFKFIPELEWDSYVTIGCLYQNGYPFNSNYLYISPGIDWTDFESGGGVFANNGTWFITPDNEQGMEQNGRVLIGQFTVKGEGLEFTWTLNIQGRDATGQTFRVFNITPAKNTHFDVFTVCESGCEYTSIQDAITTASDGDVIQVGSGTFYESNINPDGKAITIQGTRNWDGTLATTIDGQQGGSVFWIVSGEDSGTVIKDLVITGGLAITGSGIYCNSSSPTIVGCTITNNTTTGNWGGGGIFCTFSSPSISSCLISDNTANNGGGIYCYNNSNPTLDTCTITGNTATNEGGGVYCSDASSPVHSSCTFSINTPDNVYGDSDWNFTGGDEAGPSIITLEDCTICGIGEHVQGLIVHRGVTHIHHCSDCAGDINGDGIVDGADLGLLISIWGPCLP